METWDQLIQVLASTIRVSTPLLFAAMGGLICERSGIVNIALEGKMLVGAFAAAAITYYFHSPWLGMGGGLLAGVCLAAIYALFVIPLRANQIVAGTGINILALGVTPFVCKLMFGVTGSTPGLPIEDRFAFEPVVLAWVLLIVCHFWIYHTPSGLWVRFSGEHPKALDSAGIKVRVVRWYSVLAAGALAGLGGASLAIFLSSSFSRNMTAGRGFMALAALIFGKWKPGATAVACLFFGFADAMQIRLQGVVLWGEEPVPVQFIQILPYLVTILVLAGFVGKSRAPKALGVPYEVR